MAGFSGGRKADEGANESAMTAVPRGYRIGWAILLLVPSCLLAALTPWTAVFLDTLPTGGDNPAHPVLVTSLRDSLISTGSVIHYSYRYWSGCELFQFYFPLPYVVAAILSFFVPLTISYKLVTLFGVLLLPLAFARCADRMFHRDQSTLFAAFLSLGFFFTDAHQMWGGNIWSNFAGMIGNAWAVVFYLLTLGELLQCWRAQRLSPMAVLFVVLTILSHFYLTLLLALTFGTLAAFDALAALRSAAPLAYWKRAAPFYANGAFALALMAWWIVPLFVYKPYSSEFGERWEVNFWGTFTASEKIAFVSSLLVAGAALKRRQGNLAGLGVALSMLLLTSLLYFLGDIFETAALINVRIWPLVYLSLYLLFLCAADCVFSVGWRPVRFAVFASILSVLPSSSQLDRVQEWTGLNYAGIEATPGAYEFHQVVEELRKQPPARVSFESSARNNWLLGSIRAFEMLPAITPHETAEGGIVNSATNPGLAYSLQCATSTTCAGWPHGTLIPANDGPRSIELMRSLGVIYHIASSPEGIERYAHASELELLFRGKYLALFKLRSADNRIDVFDGPVPVLTFRDPRLQLLNLFRWDAFRLGLYIFDPEGAKLPNETSIAPETILNFLAAEWAAGRRIIDKAWEARGHDGQRYLNTFLFSRGQPFDAGQELADGFSRMQIGQRAFDLNVLVSPQTQRYTEVAVPLLRDEPGESPVHIEAHGYTAWLNGAPLPASGTVPISFAVTELGGNTAPFALLIFRPEGVERFRSLDVTGADEHVRNGVPGNRDLAFPQNITDRCQPSLELHPNEMVLRTRCPGKPHLLRYSYYPKWSADVPIRLGPNGYMVVTPPTEQLVLRHRFRAVDWIAHAVSAAAAVALLLFALRRSRALGLTR